MSGDPLKQRSLTNGQVISLLASLVTILATGFGLYFGLKQAIRDEIANSNLNYRLLEQRVAMLERLNKISALNPGQGPIEDPVETTNICKYTEAIFPEYSGINKKLPKKLFYGESNRDI